MISSRRFLVLWTVVSVALSILGDIAWDRAVNGWANQTVHNGPILERYALDFMYRAFFAAAIAFAQLRLLVRYRRSIGFWVPAAIIGQALVILFEASISESHLRLLSGSPDAKSWSYWLSPFLYSASAAFGFSALEAVAIWRRRWSAAWAMWIGSRIVVAVAACGVALTLTLRHKGYYPLFAKGRPLIEQVVYFLEGSIPFALSTAATAWLLDRLVFERREEASTVKSEPVRLS